MDWITLKAAEWLPDQPPFENTGATTAKNCYAGATSYLPINALTVYSAAAGTASSDYMRGAYSMKDGSNNTRVYAGDASRLYQLSATAWDDISVAGAYSGTATDERWHFAQFGPSLLVCTNYNNAVQKIVPGSAAVALGGSPPRAKYVAQIRDWIVLAHTNDGTRRANRVQWSAYNNAEYWTRNIALQSDFQDLYEGGWITGLAETGGNGLIIQEDAVHIMQYQGPPVTWSFSRIANALGSKIPGSVVTHHDRVWWWGEQEIWEYSGAGLRPIGVEKVSRTLFADLDQSYNERVTAAVDPIRDLIMWAYPGSGNVGGAPNKLLIYAWKVEKFSFIEDNVELLFRFLVPGYTLDGLDAISSSIDALPASLDSETWAGGVLNFAAFNHAHRLVTFTGTPYSAEIETPELRSAIGRNAEIINARPLHEGGAARVRFGTRANQNDTVAWGAPVETNSYGECNVRVNNRFVRARLELSGEWSHAIGVDLQTRTAGRQ